MLVTAGGVALELKAVSAGRISCLGKTPAASSPFDAVRTRRGGWVDTRVRWIQGC